ncbi:MAG: GspE/PulE family protein [Candidatus Omnitrophota bacterium]
MIRTLKEKYDEMLFTSGLSGAAMDGNLVVQVVDLILKQAIEERASDVHIEPTKEGVRIRYRIDGVLYDVLALKQAAPVVSRLKVMAELDPDIGRSHTPQDGRFNLKLGNREVDVRLATFPTILGEKLAMRILDKETTFRSLGELGFSEMVQSKFEMLIKHPNGMVFVTGPTNSGKTSTLYAVLSILNTAHVNIVTLEDPVEYQLKGVNQGQINPKVGLSFANGLRAILRQDPNIVLVGEIRDLETAEIAVRASLTGHLVFSTLHTNDAAGAVTRLIDMGVEPFLISSCLVGVLAQRLVRKICPSCKTEYSPPEAIRKEFEGVPAEKSLRRPPDRRDESFYIMSPEGAKTDAASPPPIPGRTAPKTVFYRGAGCSACRQIGYLGRIGIFELMEMNDEIRNLIITKNPSVAIKTAAVRAGMRSLRDDGFDKVRSQITTLEEVIRVTREF